MTARALWQCPECGTRMTSSALDSETARDALVLVVREHLTTIHAATADLTNAAAQASGWLSSAGHRVRLWGGPEDGAELWLPPGELPAAIGVHRGEDGQAHLLRSATARLLLQDRAATYRLAGEHSISSAVYAYDGRPR